MNAAELSVNRVRDLLAEALRLQRAEMETGFPAANQALLELTAGGDISTVLREARGLREGNVEERHLYARILVESQMPPDRRLAEVSAALAAESEPTVIRWLVWGMRNAGQSSALPNLTRLVRHSSPAVRFPVPDALSACARSFDEVADLLLELSRDADEDVRWSAVFELVAWAVDVDDDRLRTRLAEVATADPVPAIRDLALEVVRPDLPEGGT